MTTILGPFESPVDGSKEGKNLSLSGIVVLTKWSNTYDSAVADLKRLEDMQSKLRSLFTHEIANAAHRRGIVVLERADDCGCRRS